MTLRCARQMQAQSDAWWDREEARWGREREAREVVATATQTPQVAEASSQNSSHGPEGGGGLSGHAQCIIQHESGGNPNASNGQFHGIGQWSETQWQADGGHGSPASASQGEQEAVLSHESESELTQQQGQYDGCG